MDDCEVIVVGEWSKTVGELSEWVTVRSLSVGD